MNNIEGSKILVTGGAGFVGSHLIPMLLERGVEQVIIIDNFIRGSERNIAGFVNDERVVLIRDDIRNLKVLEESIAQVDYIYHMAALRIHRCAADTKEAFEVMCDATFRLVELARKHSTKKIIYSSSASIYGMADSFPTTESCHPYDNRTFYGAAKSWGEGLLRSYKDMYDLDYVALRYFNIYGPGMDTEGKYTEVMIKWLDCIKANQVPKIFGDGSTSMDFVYVEDIARANVLALQSEATDQVYNVGYQLETSLQELLQLLLKIRESSLQAEYVEERKINPVPRRLADLTAIKRDLGFSPTVDLETGMRHLVAWYDEVKGQVY